MLHKTLTCCAVAFLMLSAANGQGILKKIKDKAQQAADKVVDKKIDNAVGNNSNTGNPNSAPPDMSSVGRSGKPSNKGGEGLISTPPNVNDNLSSAETAFKAAKYSDARYSVRQAMLGVEMEIGKKILDGLPPTVSGLDKDASADKVTSAGWGMGWSGLTIQRDYRKDDKQLSFTIANNAMWMQAVNMYFNNGGYMQTSGGEQKWKQIKVQDEKAIIEYDASTGYKLSVPVGQTTLLVFEGINFANEQDFMTAVNQINIPSIKTQLGEK
ncbi:MAG TPA: hypothetical protein VI385_16705 [Flavisolibacter sp.]